jgi:hypothetical protein
MRMPAFGDRSDSCSAQLVTAARGIDRGTMVKLDNAYSAAPLSPPARFLLTDELAGEMPDDSAGLDCRERKQARPSILLGPTGTKSDRGICLPTYAIPWNRPSEFPANKYSRLSSESQPLQTAPVFLALLLQSYRYAPTFPSVLCPPKSLVFPIPFKEVPRTFAIVTWSVMVGSLPRRRQTSPLRYNSIHL